ncbi:hypothetical protein SNR37_001594 [Agarivorans aestuarii]|uniref:Uncharacterized protein n=1 Tax=Agarivorans aestuarii TaxID=1563703 RepID=A0ABU7GAS4_9ALTE|nr:hypothetical protein [Agarivorans aestuarii]MEE1676262.1 hypothetical protein [Agarivorans aestuarii]
MTCRLLSALLLTLGLTACNDSPESDPLNQVFLYTQTVFAEDAGQHYCIAIDENEPQLIESSLEMRFPKDDAETHDFISHCRELYRNQLSSPEAAY